MIKLIITDMDGTLLNSKDEINQEFWEIEEKLAKNGTIFAIASGRPHYNLVTRFPKTKDNMLFISDNGACVMYKEEELYSNPLSRECIHFLLDICSKIKGIIPVVCGKTSAYVDKKAFDTSSDEVQKEIRKYYNKLAFVENLYEVEDEFLKIAICDFLISEKNSYPYFKELEDKYQVVVSGKVWLDLGKLDTNKGRAIEMTQKKLGISFDETMVFGDYLNDSSMMSKAKYSYAMKNAHPQLKELANFVTEKDNDNNGVLETVKEYFHDIL